MFIWYIKTPLFMEIFFYILQIIETTRGKRKSILNLQNMKMNETGDYYCSMIVGTTRRKSNAIRIIVFGKLTDKIEDYFRDVLPPEMFCKKRCS